MDIRALHQDLKSDAESYARVLEQAPVGLALLKRGGNEQIWLLYANAVLRQLVGLKENADPSSFRSFLCEPDYRELLERMDNSAGDANAPLELQLWQAGHDPVSCQVAIKPIEIHGEALFIFSAQDLTAIKLAEEKMLQEVGLEQREDFIATLTHDLKTPIVGANMVLSALLEGTIGSLAPKQHEIILKLKASNHALLKMIQNLLEVYKYQSGTQSLSMQPVDLVDIANFCAEEVKPLLENKRQTLRVQMSADSIPLVCDGYAMQRVLINLLGNAVKFTPEGGIITLSAELQADGVTIQVVDTGSGISIEDQRSLFQRFWQGEPGKRYAAGTGLGLYFCHHVVRAHHGSISCKSEPGLGTTFTIVLPSA